MSSMKKIGLGILGILILASIIGGFALLGAEAYRMFSGSDEPRRASSGSGEPASTDTAASGTTQPVSGQAQLDPDGNYAPIHVQVLDPAKKPLADVTVHLVDAGNPPFIPLAKQQTDESGLCVFRGLDRDRYGFFVDVEPFVQQSNSHVFPGEQIVFELEDGAPLTGVVRDATTGQLLEGVLVHATNRDLAAFRQNQVARTDAEGRYEFRSASTRPLNMRFMLDGFQSEDRKEILVHPSSGSNVDVSMTPGLTVSGWVTDAETGDPIPGAAISFGFGIFEQEASFTTDERGMFTLRGVGRGKLMIRARAPGYAPGRTNLDLRRSNSETAVEIELKRWTTVAGTVRDMLGQPIGGAEVLLQEDAFLFKKNSERLAVTGRDGRFEAQLEHARGDVRLKAVHPDYTPGFSEPIVVRAGENLTEIEIVLPVGGRIVGVVTQEDGGPLAGARINLYQQPVQSVNNPAVRPDAPFQQRPRGQVTHSVTAATDGRFEIRGIEPGTKILEIRAEGFLDEIMNDVLVIDGENVGPLDIVMSRGHRLAGSVADTSGEPIAGARVSVMLRKGKGGRASAAVTTGPEGEFALDGLARGTYDLYASHAGFVRKDVKGIEAGAKDLQIELEQHGGISGMVVFAATGQIPDTFEVRLFDLATDASSAPILRKSFSSRKGKFHLESVAPGSYELLVDARGFVPTSVSPLSVGESIITEGVEVFVDSGASIAGHVQNPTGGPIRNADVFVRSLDESNSARPVVGPVRTDGNGAYFVTGLMPGRYEVSASADNLSSAVAPGIYLGASDEAIVDLTLVASGALRLRVVDGFGDPIEGVRIEFQGDETFVDPKSLRLVAKLGQGAALQRALDRLHRTDVTGFVGFNSVPYGKYQVSISHPDLGSRSVTVEVSEERRGTQEIVLD